MGDGAGINGTSHPVHIHGHHFYIMKMGYPIYDKNNNNFYSQNNPDIDCRDDTELCNNAKWANESFNNGSLGYLANFEGYLKKNFHQNSHFLIVLIAKIHLVKIPCLCQLEAMWSFDSNQITLAIGFYIATLRCIKQKACQ